MKLFAAALCLSAFPLLLSAQQQQRAEILVLGTFHMDNPARDVHNLQVDDVMSANRQKQIELVLEVLSRFHPNRIAIESEVGGRRATHDYADYLAGRYTLTRNEIDQLGYRLAKLLGHQAVYPVDEGGDFPFYRVRNYAIANGLKDQFEAEQARVDTRVKAENQYLRTHSVLEMLQLLNADSSAATAVGEYYTGFLPFGEPYEYAGPDLIASWFQRNLRIYHNVRALITAPTDRVLVIYGSGHLGWLRQIVASDPSVRLRTLAELSPDRGAPRGAATHARPSGAHHGGQRARVPEQSARCLGASARGHAAIQPAGRPARGRHFHRSVQRGMSA